MQTLLRRTAAALAALAAAALAAPLLAACGPKPPPVPCPQRPVAGLAVAVGDRANSPAPNLPDQLTSMVNAVMRQKSGVTIITVDGKPAVFCGMAFNPDQQGINPHNKDALKTYERNFVSSVGAELRSARAVAPEADPLTALSYAAAAAGRNGTVVLVDSGLQTVAPLDFRQHNLLTRDPQLVVDDLAKRHLLPDLSGRTVLLAGIGYTAPPQQQLDPATRTRLVTLWTLIAKRGGASTVNAVTTPNTRRALIDDPKVSPVPPPQVNTVAVGCGTTIVLPDNGAVGFVPNTARLRDPAAAKVLLSKAATWLDANSSATVRLDGSVAHYSNGPEGLSQKRAQTVADVLAGLGVSRSRMTVHGDGWGPYPSSSAPPSTDYDQLNRRVLVAIFCG